MKSIQNTLQYVNDNWSTIVIILGLLVAIYTKVKSYMKLSDQEKIDLAKNQLKITILKYVSDAELEWSDYKKSGWIKRSEVIDKIFADYPILNRVTDQETLIKEIDNLIDESLVKMREVLENDSENSDTTVGFKAN